MTPDSPGAGASAGAGAPTGTFSGLAAVVTGGASGIGLATATLLAARGARVACVDLAPGPVPAGLLGLPGDVTSGPSITAAVQAAAAALDGIDVLVNNAGVGALGTIEDNPEDEWRRVLDVNVVGLVRTSRAALPFLRRSRHAAIVNTCSIAATVGLPQRALYGASKGAVQALTMAMAADHVGEGIRVCCVNPATVDTPWVRRLLAAADDPEAEFRALQARQPTGRIVSPAEVAEAIAYLASPLAGSTTGVALAVDGGMDGLRLPGNGRGQPDDQHIRRTGS
ncbi:MAG: SDR family oxidoreductase [Dactylosporangium sp.]|nr:SDR family oxidoreductase [Dactylosporangium sp.]NNJ61275.1 SDR family oxidoreductase [Dactylosporangium sp.]